jgi:hypothetical protein
MDELYLQMSSHKNADDISYCCPQHWSCIFVTLSYLNILCRMNENLIEYQRNKLERYDIMIQCLEFLQYYRTRYPDQIPILHSRVRWSSTIPYTFLLIQYLLFIGSPMVPFLLPKFQIFKNIWIPKLLHHCWTTVFLKEKGDISPQVTQSSKATWNSKHFCLKLNFIYIFLFWNHQKYFFVIFAP